jgi:hypothetical protein
MYLNPLQDNPSQAVTTQTGQSLHFNPQWTEGLAIYIDRALDKAVWLYVAMYGYTT